MRFLIKFRPMEKLSFKLALLILAIAFCYAHGIKSSSNGRLDQEDYEECWSDNYEPCNQLCSSSCFAIFCDAIAHRCYCRNSPRIQIAFPCNPF
ncbi:hypothetical protein Tsubulata_035179 [Turnera subulata]|uniref:Knottin scorpion toxin-like domain-containing protein n=1 Tax=Turnera subulata TaxID=218843 RepID=A0A9Q0F408_9ROSI|nr:hypothetical protein Tsubulata_035179 [Turnera subulata]